VVTGIYDSFYQYIKGKKIYISNKLKNDLGKDTWNDPLREFAGFFTVDKTKGIAIDSLYVEMTAMFPYIMPDDIMNEHDQLLNTFEVLRLARKGRKGELYKIEC